MGGGSYSYNERSIRATSEEYGYYTKSVDQIFDKREISPEMDPKNIVVRESRDSDEHPDSFPIIIALDVTGSMGYIPHELIKDGLPTIMKTIMDAGINDAQVLFMAVGDHTYDKAPLQVGQFETSDELLDHWLTSVWLEKGGGANDGESYLLAWYFAGKKTVTDSFEKRGIKGMLFTIGDEPCVDTLADSGLKAIFGDGQYVSVTAKDCLDEANKTYNVFHIALGRRGIKQYKELLGQHLLECDDSKKITEIIANTSINYYNRKNGSIEEIYQAGCDPYKLVVSGCPDKINPADTGRPTKDEEYDNFINNLINK